MRMMLSGESNIYCARTLANWVFPTPVGPRNKNVPIGLFGSFRPALLRCMARVTVSTASSCPMIFSLSDAPIVASLFPSLWAILLTGMLVAILTTCATSSAVTSEGEESCLRCHFWRSCSSSARFIFSMSLNIAAFSKSDAATASCFSATIISIAFSRVCIFFGTLMFFRCTRLPASSIMSMALSGRQRSVIYLWLIEMQAIIASSEYTTLWCFWYLSFMLPRISKVCSKFVGSTITFWNLLSRAPSFSMNWRNSSSVVAPMHCISPRARAGLSIFAASREPAAPPAPTRVCISSMNNMMCGFFPSSFRIAFILSSNCPRYFVPATIEPISSDTTLFPCSTLETFFFAILIASPSAMADFPTPGSPMSTGLFFFLLPRICASLSISFSLPTTGSNLSSIAAFVRSYPKLSSTGVLPPSAPLFTSILMVAVPLFSSRRFSFSPFPFTSLPFSSTSPPSSFLS